MQDDALVTSDGERLAYRFWERAGPVEPGGPAREPRGVLIAVHGAGGHYGLIAPLADHLAELGFVTYAYDQRGHGRNRKTGTVPAAGTLVNDFVEVVGLIAARHETLPVYVAGTSMGGSIILAAAGTDGLPDLAGVILLAPAVDGWRTVPWHLRPLLWLGARLAPRRVLERPDDLQKLSDNTDYLRLLASDPTVVRAMSLESLYNIVELTEVASASAPALEPPALILYGENDSVVSKDAVLRLSDRIGGSSRTIVYANGYHELLWDRQRANVLGDIAAWLSAPDRPMPSLQQRPRLAEEYRAPVMPP